MLVKDFTFDLPQELIARHPLAARDSSRLMLLGRASGTVAEDTFCNLQKYLRPGDLLVMNDTRVIPARLFGSKPTGGKVEIFLLRRLTGGEELWECLLRSSKKFREGQEVLLESGMTAVVRSRCDSENWLIEFRGEEPFNVWLDREGHIPLPPYLQREDGQIDRERYQTVVAREPAQLPHRPPDCILPANCWISWLQAELKLPFLRCIPAWALFSRCAPCMLKNIRYILNALLFRMKRLMRSTGRKPRVAGLLRSGQHLPEHWSIQRSNRGALKLAAEKQIFISTPVTTLKL